MLRKAITFFKTPKGLVTIVLLILTLMAAPGQGFRTAIFKMATASATAGFLDLFILRLRKKVWEFPSGAVITAMIVAMVLRVQEPWYVVAITSAFAILSKYVVRSRTANVFNPAALAILVSFYVFHTGQNWWGALVDVEPVAKVLMLGAGMFIADRVNKMPMVISFLGAYFALFTIAAFFGNPLRVAEIFRTPDADAAMYFAFFILTDPPTSPAKYRDQVICGAIVAVTSFALFEAAGVVYYLLAGVLVGNVWEAWRRVQRRSKVRFPAGLGVFLLEIGPGRRVAK
jgi:Na+-translocating ferredoxin:NAD+ oxidoreductase RnfD subunit